MTDLFLALQTPVIEMVLSGLDPAGRTATYKVGFTRHDIETATEIFDKISEANAPLDFLREQEEEGIEVSREQRKNAAQEVRETMDNIIRKEILYFKDIQLFEPIPNKIGEFKKGLLIADTRNTTEIKELGGQEPLAFLLEMFLASSLWRNKLIDAMVKAISNLSLGKEAETKN